MNIENIYKDTTPEALRVHFSILRNLGQEGRANMAIELSDGLRATIEAGIRQRHPEYDDNKVRLAIFCLTLGDKLFSQCYPDIKVKK